jgi:cyclic pyranopterin monophosphate synthase
LANPECVGLVARPVFKTGLRAENVRGGSIPPHSAFEELLSTRALCWQADGCPADSYKPEVSKRRFRKMTSFSHLDEEGAARMVDVGGKAMIQRTATATGRISMSQETVELLREKALPKGDALNTARIAGVMAAKRTPDLIPLCHGLNLTSVDLDFAVSDDGVEILGVARANDRTGVEMEALIAVSVAALTLYDMCKAVDKGMEIGDIKLLEKTKEKFSW